MPNSEYTEKAIEIVAKEMSCPIHSVAACIDGSGIVNTAVTTTVRETALRLEAVALLRRISNRYCDTNEFGAHREDCLACESRAFLSRPEVAE